MVYNKHTLALPFTFTINLTSYKTAILSTSIIIIVYVDTI